jgi:hypothetical protein
MAEERGWTGDVLLQKLEKELRTLLKRLDTPPHAVTILTCFDVESCQELADFSRS